MVEYDKIVRVNKENQPVKCNGCSRGDQNGTVPCMPKGRVCCACDFYGKEEVEHYL